MFACKDIFAMTASQPAFARTCCDITASVPGPAGRITCKNPSFTWSLRLSSLRATELLGRGKNVCLQGHF